MHGLLESVPNFSEGRDAIVIEAIRAAMVDAGGRVLDVHSDADHNRSVFTLVADADSLVDALAAAISVAVARIDLRSHEGVHPRVGAADVVPLVRFDPEDDRPERAARALTRRIAMLGVPALGYGELGEGRRPAFFRQGGTERLEERLAAGEIESLAGPAQLHPTAGAVLVGVRPPLVAFNIDLATDDVEIARAIASAIRERDGGLAGVQALGLRAHGRAQVSTNLIDVEGTPLAAVVSAVDRLAGEHGTTIAGSELVGLMPARIAASAAASALRLPSLPVERLLEVAVAGEFGATQL
ncbi:MAG: glutamate formiminotransferase / 5-formyltetrahydrofolate cyclo-ligase [Gaiellales bacterium]|nr:glutamate formiminotransferase / 5-formyltetrahydrofolate cyclo-ligase [Gaiellales bacterium]